MDSIDVLKRVIIEDYQTYMKKVRLGRSEDITHILDKLYYLECFEGLDKVEFIYERLINRR